MAEEPQKVVVIVNASKDVSSKAIMKALKKTCPQARDEVKLIAILEELSSPMGINIRVHDDSFFAANRKIVDGQLAKIREDFQKSSAIMKLSEYCEIKKMDFQIDVVAHPFIEVASDAAKCLGTTWLIVDRHVGRDKKKWHLPCGIFRFRIRSNNTIEQLWGPEKYKSRSSSQSRKMIPGNVEEEV